MEYFESYDRALDTLDKIYTSIENKLKDIDRLHIDMDSNPEMKKLKEKIRELSEAVSSFRDIDFPYPDDYLVVDLPEAICYYLGNTNPSVSDIIRVEETLEKLK